MIRGLHLLEAVRYRRQDTHLPLGLDDGVLVAQVFGARMTNQVLVVVHGLQAL